MQLKKKYCLAIVLFISGAAMAQTMPAANVNELKPAMKSDSRPVVKSVKAASYQDLLQIFVEWRNFERPPLRDGAPDYSLERRLKTFPQFKQLRERLTSMDTRSWTKEQQVDWKIVRAEMNGYDFNHRVLQPWVRDPAFYQSIFTEASDTPAREGPTNHATVELWRYQFPLNTGDQEKLAREIAVIPHLLKQAKANLTGNARDLWIAGISTLEQQVADLQDLEQKTASYGSTPLKQSIALAMAATSDFVVWLHEKSASKNGPSGVGKENYTWYQQNVHLVPMTWQQEVDLLQRELDRAWANLKLEEQRNKNLPPMIAAASVEEFNARADRAATKLMRFLNEKNVMPIKPNMEPAIREHLQSFVPEDKRNFFSITLHYDPLALYCHWYHWFDLAQIRDEPHASPIRRSPLLFNLWDNRNEGIATGVEEMFMHMGLHDDSPRSRELVWILLAQRAARGLGSLYAHANLKNMEEASRVHLDWTPRNWMRREPHLLKFEQHLYLRQPGYGTSYVVGKYLIEKLMTQKAKQAELQHREFDMKLFFQQFNDIGSIPVSLTSEQMLAQ
ncbi:hypothetical protein H8K35_02295 [Undibacterium sp. LX40W]|uniref:DUF885 domain-containing protein n=1 Tax=Undibacterium nitidum TaxID=2762298 RepID=A0A923HJY8_9BURK|nr:MULTISPECIES: hypothetical protein [Undibacterium]MBC3880789.1 hypothetical protein [Undibacterium nitidum]MBC3890478.1 hypothetical protein [Undibacterium sp. LX40W]